MGLLGEEAFELRASNSVVTSASVRMWRKFRRGGFGGKSGFVADLVFKVEFKVLE